MAILLGLVNHMLPDQFIELYYGQSKIIDLHNMTKQEAFSSLIFELNSVDRNIDCLIIIHGYHGGTVIKNLVRSEFKHEAIAKKINLDAGRTIYLLKK